MGMDRKTSEPACGRAGVVQRADAQCVDGAVELTFDVTTESGALERLQMRMPREIAQEFALRLVRCAASVACIMLFLVGSLRDGPLRPNVEASCGPSLSWSPIMGGPHDSRNALCGAHRPSDFVGLRRHAVSPHAPKV
jgi:hypothetical protein